MTFQLPELPYDKAALAPVLSEETLDYHYGKHHAAYVKNLNALVEGTENEKATLEDIIRSSTGGLFNNAAQIWNHTFYWNCLSPNGGGNPNGDLADAIEKAFGSVEEFKKQFSSAAVKTFGSGWAWLVKTDDGGLAIETTANADTPVAQSKTALLTFDVWEHAYYIDYRNARPAYVEKLWDIVNWDFVSANFKG